MVGRIWPSNKMKWEQRWADQEVSVDKATTPYVSYEEKQATIKENTNTTPLIKKENFSKSNLDKFYGSMFKNKTVKEIEKEKKKQKKVFNSVRRSII